MKPWLRAADHAGITLDQTQIEKMARFGRWLATEGVAAGGIGPAEIPRIDHRHLGDSVLFAGFLDSDPEQIWDLGSGVGLPGVPLAICLPGSEVVLIDRSGRRTDLLRRVTRILELPNCQVVQTEISELTGATGVIVSRATLPPDRLHQVMSKHLDHGGVGVAGGSWTTRPRAAGWEISEIPHDVLDQTIWFLIMRRQ
ncbi:MAG TPA: RsmG family class I SAM-dependent methyltransferase [Acidimicrobiia bacterium]|nr:RsmG family class I SAM-dependent methyltransferase [Acidimicrobiia bacterium]